MLTPSLLFRQRHRNKTLFCSPEPCCEVPSTGIVCLTTNEAWLGRLGLRLAANCAGLHQGRASTALCCGATRLLTQSLGGLWNRKRLMQPLLRFHPTCSLSMLPVRSSCTNACRCACRKQRCSLASLQNSYPVCCWRCLLVQMRLHAFQDVSDVCRRRNCSC